eukprot:CAMPEP_0173413716 /NCGR_PEP_ID=MMETSP1356-20130122/82660_1 /TAXON_ID=77927 ORGANISM="Hemiselmis virescens, Strain PCC157" /NCGR_SAMPLE_ID=MMETSP1356 /ASSEMBLY_ACC=CAM_ASM_000847 /LENGTH=141 /DNA_ID=CAMNT_0014375787 /DNA_START=181 /DNA_END=602 /DNA_ORIENTATION=-
MLSLSGPPQLVHACGDDACAHCGKSYDLWLSRPHARNDPHHPPGQKPSRSGVEDVLFSPLSLKRAQQPLIYPAECRETSRVHCKGASDVDWQWPSPHVILPAKVRSHEATPHQPQQCTFDGTLSRTGVTWYPPEGGRHLPP